MRGPKRTLIQERFTETSDGMGGFTRTWYTLREIKGTFYGLGGDEMIQQGKIEGIVTHKFITKIVDGETIKLTDRFRDPDSDAYYEIKYIDDAVNRANWWSIRLKQYDVVTP